MWLTKAHTSQEAPTSTSGSSSRKATISNILKSFIENDILFEKKNDDNVEIKRNKQYILKKYLDIFSKGIE
ncbi:hypothetical protein [Fusobacterium periodonticum]|uniref:Uncharacterized protein n=1 Tax=Fusobacterium periodonticum ATCC 33693 TaxID=546275 RepID=D4CYS6_9FUSO|nr:hypothetical protein [Fusobacterium periodonticum]EFE85499.1 hypothetical protein FUSPEROL_02591 [Fusobacterium periodonticum ATCC 33693]